MSQFIKGVRCELLGKTSGVRGLSVTSKLDKKASLGGHALRYKIQVALTAEVLVDSSCQAAIESGHVDDRLLSAIAHRVFGEFMTPLNEILEISYELGAQDKIAPIVDAMMNCMRSDRPMLSHYTISDNPKED